MKKKINILVTGCGGDFGMNIGRILKMTDAADRLIGVDMLTHHAGSMVFDKCKVVKRADHQNYFQNLGKIVKKYSIQLIIPTPEAEIRAFFNKNYLDEFEGVPLILPNKKAIEAGLDKLETVKFLKENKLVYPWTRSVKEDPKELPCIIKPRFDQGSKNVCVVEKEFVDYYRKKYSDSIWQELLLPDDQEYTCGLYRTRQKEVRTIVFRRSLQGGFTGSGEVIKNVAIEKLLVDIADKLNLEGSINVQLRLTEKAPVVFEINSRFSSTVMFRHLLGFQDLMWAIYERFDLKIKNYLPPVPGTRIYRGSQEYIISP